MLRREVADEERAGAPQSGQRGCLEGVVEVVEEYGGRVSVVFDGQGDDEVAVERGRRDDVRLAVRVPLLEEIEDEGRRFCLEQGVESFGVS